MPDDSDDGRRWGFRLPPIRLPEFFPDDFELRFLIPERIRGDPANTRWLLVLALVIDVIDAALLFWVTGPALLARSFVVFVLAIGLANAIGLFVVWEFIAVLLGSASATVAPSVTIGFLVRRHLDRA